MRLLSFARSLYNIDTLDTRFTNPSFVPYQTVIDARTDPELTKDSLDKSRARGHPSKWKTPEFKMYICLIAFIIPYMLWMAYDVSRPSDPRYDRFSRYLSPGWIFGRKIDASDNQYYVFRKNLPYMCSLLLFHPLLRRVWNAVYPTKRIPQTSQSRLDQRASFDYAFAFIFLTALHGSSALKVLFILYINYQLATKLPRRYIPAATWTFNICTLFANELSNGYQFRNIANYVSPPVTTTVGNGIETADSRLMCFGHWLDGFKGILARWEILFNITILRLISFNLDYYWSLDRSNSSSLEKQLDPANLSERDRVYIPADVKDFSFRNYVGYVIYAPLYLAGPILTFNDYISQQRYRPATIETSRTIRYAIRLLLVFLAMEVMLHINYIGAIGKANPDWGSYTAGQLGLLSFLNLHIIWMKLLLPWRLFRLWSLVDGIDPPENMVRCVNNNFSTQLFWRAWHRSYNRWLVRYIFVPLGGASFRNWRATVRSIVTYLVAFTFVALWHDIKMRLLIWGWLIVLFMIPEWTANHLFPKRRWEQSPNYYRMLCCMASVGNIFMMVSANLVGFALGLDGFLIILRQILHDWSGVIFLFAAISSLFVTVQIMFEVRNTERRQGVVIRC
ncbi:MBOAT, membrane-bound O-acyltransferase family-domain-containing protein [Ilyonectria robusta]|uniref:MBOAT, membrane-bound O-acyltransferase family-domain-containing protein n=1 Tax=Ilyonectria robusta TaxID=1079257 RepID=UPI001E8EB6D4|nr:MBOAT, membrane-bound O-acyltransferase family-domain-containing protein [Ilyonectria robusta]KAH8736643.1 MBOAT, membrane-bound O-acyltransferase family-domain-containing protein [Ilyonectria robusta]